MEKAISLYMIARKIKVRFVVKLNHGIQPVHKLTNPTPIMEKKG